MSEFEDRREQSSPPKRKRPGIGFVIALALVGIFAVLTLTNLRALRAPFSALFAVLSPVIVGLVLAYLLNFFVRFFECKLFKNNTHRKRKRAISMLLSYILLLAIIAGIVWLILPSALDSCRDLLMHRSEYIVRLFDSSAAFIDGLGISGIDSETLHLADLRDTILTKVSDAESIVAQLTLLLEKYDAAGMMGSAITAMKNLVVGVFISIYVLFSKERLAAGSHRVLRALFSEKAEQKILHYCAVANNKFGGYMVGKLADSTMVMLVCMLLFYLFRIPYPMLIAVIIGVTDIIPFFGPFLGAIPSALIILIADPPKAILFLALILLVQQIDGNIIAPAILGNKTGLSSLGVIIAVAVMGDLFGIPGMVIGVPLFALIVTLADDFIKSRLSAKGADTDLYSYFPADAFLRPEDLRDEHETLAQRFGKWVRDVETERAGVDYTPSPLHTIGRGIRRILLAFGKLFTRIFSLHPIAADRKRGSYRDITNNGMRTDRGFWRTLLLSIVTLGIYPLYMVSVIAETTNIACRADKRRTWSALPFLLLSIVTLGIFPLVWHCKVIARWTQYCEANGERCTITKRFYLGWTIFGTLVLFGPLIALARFFKAHDQIAELFNATHTFPLSDEDLREIEQPENEPHREHVPLIDQIVPPHDLEEQTAQDAATDEQAEDESDHITE